MSKLREKLKYKRDSFMAKGLPSLLIMLVITTLIFLALFTLLLLLISNKLHMKEQAAHAFWYVFTHMLDPGTVTATDSHNNLYLIVMVFITLIGLIVNSTLIGTITNAIDTKLKNLRAGKSKIIEKGHTVIIGLNESTFPMLEQLILANENKRKAKIVLVENDEHEKIVEKVNSSLHDSKKTSIICRGGNYLDCRVLDKLSIKDANSVIVTYKSDFDTLKILSALNQYVIEYQDGKPTFNVACLIKEKKNLEPAKYIGKSFANVIYFNESLARIIAHSCRYPGLLKVLYNMFDYEDNELYIEKFSELEGKTFGEVLTSFNKACILGIVEKNKTYVNPPMDRVYRPSNGEELIIYEQDNGKEKPNDKNALIDIKDVICENIKDDIAKEIRKLLILGQNHLLENILEEFNNYCKKGSVAHLAGKNLMLSKDKKNLYSNLSYDTVNIDIFDREVIKKTLIEGGYDTVLVLCDLYTSLDEADCDVLINLANLRAIIEENNLDINIITEMRAIEDEKISKSESISDFVVGANVTNLLLTQLSETPRLFPILKELLDEEGNEIYMRKACNYVKTGVNVNSYQVQEIIKNHNYILIGYKLFIDGRYIVRMNVDKDKDIKLTDRDYLIVVAED